MAEREHGVVKWYNTGKGYGFITRDGGGDLFVHFTALRDDAAQGLKVGQRVEYEVSEGERGPMASDVAAAG